MNENENMPFDDSQSLDGYFWYCTVYINMILKKRQCI